MRKNVDDLRLTFNSLYDELKKKNIYHGSKPMFYIARGNMFWGLYARKQSKIVEELKNRKKPITLDNDQITPYFDRLHWEMSILIITELLKRIDEKTDLRGHVTANSSYFLEFARDTAAHYKEMFKSITGKTPYEDLLVLIDGSEKEIKSRKEYEGKVHDTLTAIYKKRFDNTKYAKENPFECEAKTNVTNVKVNPNTPSKAKVTKEVVGVQLSLFGDEEVEITIKRRTPTDK